MKRRHRPPETLFYLTLDLSGGSSNAHQHQKSEIKAVTSRRQIATDDREVETKRSSLTNGKAAEAFASMWLRTVPLEIS